MLEFCCADLPHMDEREPTKDQLIRELNAVRQEFDRMQIEREALEAQRELLHTLVACGERPQGSLLVRALCQQTLRIANRLAQVEESSVFILDDRGIVRECVLARGATGRQQRDTLLGRVLDKGLAGWVSHERRTAIVTDTTTDERWLQLPGQPYTVRSVLCLPMLRQQHLLGIVTLMHPEPGHFHAELAGLMEEVASRVGLVLEVVRCLAPDAAPDGSSDGSSSPMPMPKTLRVKTTPPKPPAPPPSSAPATPARQNSHQNSNNRAPNSARPVPPAPRPSERLPSPQPPPAAIARSRLSSLSRLGLYIVVWDGKFLFANPQLARIFGYKTEELAGLKTMFSLIAEVDYNRVSEQVYKCVRGQTDRIHCYFQGKHKRGKTVRIELYGVRTRFYGKPVVVGALRRLSKQTSAKSKSKS